VNLCSQAFIERAKLKMMPSSHQFGFTQVDGTLTNEVGQCIDIPFELGGMSVPISVVVLKNMDVDLILGRPFLEQTSAKADYATGCFCLSFNGWIAIVDANKHIPVSFRAVPGEDDVHYYFANYPGHLDAWLNGQLREEKRIPVTDKNVFVAIIIEIGYKRAPAPVGVRNAR